LGYNLIANIMANAQEEEQKEEGGGRKHTQKLYTLSTITVIPGGGRRGNGCIRVKRRRWRKGMVISG